jgi:transposase
VVALILYSYCKGERSSRGIERECWEDGAYRVICATLTPDHVTINRFRSEHQDALAGLFGQVLRLCAKAGMVNVGTIAVDGTRVRANASRRRRLITRSSLGRFSRRPRRSMRRRTSLR